jgi:hypothetical protein
MVVVFASTGAGGFNWLVAFSLTGLVAFSLTGARGGIASTAARGGIALTGARGGVACFDWGSSWRLCFDWGSLWWRCGLLRLGLLLVAVIASTGAPCGGVGCFDWGSLWRCCFASTGAPCGGGVGCFDWGSSWWRCWLLRLGLLMVALLGLGLLVVAVWLVASTGAVGFALTGAWLVWLRLGCWCCYFDFLGCSNFNNQP